ncbi:bifunctional (p)ppGpp synthetase/guanosine-3',5'-bis(diphosphate) 3'-pyrophosphohydrolase [Myxococcota bacterium]|nr:bifunctional (p)ppGpp synthetase/guanosine-3',5'-bis(diphosphate) 3'-pyrophosphohydrolase [Myxococcota bacterium]
MLRFNDIADRMLEYNPSCDLELLQRAYVFSAKVHEGQERLSGEPYLVHPLEVAGILVDTRMDDTTVAAGLLHDAIEDTLTSADEIQRLFGESVAFLVEGLTKIAKIEFKSHRERQAENFRKMLVAMSKDIRILLIKLADRLHNMRTLGYLDEESRIRIAQETVDIYAPLAHRLGINWMKQELEDLAFRTLHPEIAKELEDALHSKRAAREHYVEEVIGVLSEKIAESGLQPIMTGRLKDLASIHQKMVNNAVSIDEVYDKIAFRIVVDDPQENVYGALGIVHSTWVPVAGRFKDYVALPKPNGYQSLHTTVIGPYGERMEVQIRTTDMHHNAEFGIAAHWKYKEGRLEFDEDDEKFAWLRQLVDLHREVSDPHEFIDTVKVDLFPGEVFVFTPKGDVIDLPRGATPLDFAFAIHSEVGERCSGAVVNGKMVPLRHKLNDGDTVEVQTSVHQYPRNDWLEFVVSSRARSAIRHSIRAREKENSYDLGVEILDRELKKVGLSAKKVLSDGSLEALAKRDRRTSAETLISAVGYGRAPAAEIVRKLKGGEPSGTRQALRPSPSVPKTSPGPTGIRVSGQSEVLVRFGKCCSPLPGEDVIGFVTRGRGVTVHAKECAKVFELDPDRRIGVDWDCEEATPRRVKVSVRSRDRPGLLAKVTKTISSASINIGAARVSTTRDGRAEQTYELWVRDVATLKSVMKEIERIEGVQSVERLRA